MEWTIGVAIPTYNRETDLCRAIDSVFAQTHRVDEIVVVDDGSTDGTERAVARYGHPVRYIRQTNSGPSVARNRAIAEISSRWVAFLDSDDHWLPRKIERQLAELQRKPEAVLAYTGQLDRFHDGRLHEIRGVQTDDPLPLLRVRNFLPLSSVVARRDVVLEAGGFDNSISYSEDWDLWFRMALRGPFAVAAEPLTVLNESAGSLSANVDRMVAGTAIVAEKSLLQGLSGWRREVWRRRIASAELYRGFITMRDRNKAEATKYLWESLLAWPSPGFLPKRFAAVALSLRGRSAA